MGWIDLGNPRPRHKPKWYGHIRWPEGARVKLETHPIEDPKSVPECMRSRISRRSFDVLQPGDLAQLLALACRAAKTFQGECGTQLSHRPSPSAGAIHPIHLVVHEFGSAHWQRYDPYSHELISIPNALTVSAARASFDVVLPSERSTLLLFVAEPGKTSAKYENAESLIWRDAGVLQGFMALAAESMGLSFCLLGITGEPWASSLINQPGLVGVGAAYVGRPLAP